VIDLTKKKNEKEMENIEEASETGKEDKEK